MPQRPPTAHEGARAWILVSQLGLTICAPIVAAVWAAVYFEVGGVAFVGLVLLGILVGGYGAYRVVSPYLS